MLYFIDYDLRKQRNYQPLYDELRRLGAIRMLESLWCMNSTNTAVTLRDHLTGYFDGNDGLCISQVTDWATRGIANPPSRLKSAA